MKENSIERDIHLLESYAGMTHKITDNQGRPKLDQAIEHILSDYKRVLKELEEKTTILLAGAEKVKQLEKENKKLKEDRNNNNEMVALARNEVLNYMTGYEDGKKHKMTATAQVVENQQYYIIQKQMEKYEEHIKRLQKENERLKEKHKITCELNVGLLENMKECIPKQVIRDKIKELSKYRDLAKELIEHKIVVADSDSLNYGRAEAHYKDTQVLKELLGE